MASKFDQLVADALAHHKAGRLDLAEAAYRDALGVSPGHAAITHNLGVLAAAKGQYRAAIGQFDAAIAAEPQYASAHYNRAAALQALGQSREAIESFARVCAIEPGHYEAHRALGFLWLAAGDRGRSLDHFARTYELRRGEDRSGIAARSLTETTRGKLLHDAAQFRYLAERRRDRQRFETLAGSYEEVAKSVAEEAAPLSDQQLDALGEDYNTAIHIGSAPELIGPAVSERLDGKAIVHRFRERQAAWFDGLLTPPALLGLQRHLLESTIWHDFSHIGGFVASYLEDGLACPLLLQIADETRGAFPTLLREHPLSQAWAMPTMRRSASISG
jgi:tetratricopeptide (TPR) repeat protein